MNRHWILILVPLSTVWGCATQSGIHGWTTLLDGAHAQTLGNWHAVGENNWRVEADTIMADATTGKTGTYLVSNQSYSNLRIRAQVWVTAQTNSGVFFRCAETDRISSSLCYEMNIWDVRPDPIYGTASIVDHAKVDPMPHAGGKWSTFEILADGSHLVVWMDGKKTAETRDATHTRGPIALQWAGGTVKWRKVEVLSID
jgi:hypothetical protein